MIKVLTTAEVSAKTNLTPRSVRRRLGNEFPTVVTIQSGSRTLLGTTDADVTNYIRNQKNSGK